MKATTLGNKLLGAALSAALLLSVCACGGQKKTSIVNTGDTKLSDSTTDLMSGVKAVPAKCGVNVSEDFISQYNQFAFALFQQASFNEAVSSVKQDKSMMISPLSVMPALAMTLNGADGETAAQMRQVLGGADLGVLNEQLGAFVKTLPSDEKAKLSMANSIWLREGVIKPKTAFLQTNAQYYNAGLYSAAFDDSTCKDINQWVSDNTDGMIDQMLDNIPDSAVMYLMNALAFDGEWKKIYTESDVWQGKFYGTAGEQSVEMMHSMESGYLDDGKATGFIKPYASGYSFVALLPNQGLSIDEYVGSLDGGKLRSLMQKMDDRAVSVNLPQFRAEYETDLSGVLKAMGMTDAFDADRADFSDIGVTESGDNLYINTVKHKTFISVNERGTKAGAATSVELEAGSAIMIPVVYLDRPFVYMIIENETCLPVFMGTVMNVQ